MPENMIFDRLRRSRLELVVFFGGAIGMIIELVGSRVISPYFGNSLVVWTSLIGVVLGCLSAGYYFGGRLADRHPSYTGLSGLILIGAIALGLTAFFKDPVLSMMQFIFGYDLRAASFLAVLILFGPVSVTLGMIAPFAAKLRLADIGSTGKVVGNLYALSTFGSITGTFAAGFWLIPLFGNSDLLFGLALSLLILSAVPILMMDSLKTTLFALLIGLFYLNQTEGLFMVPALADVDSLYNRIRVWEIEDADHGKVVVMGTDNTAVQSAYIPDRPEELFLEYSKAFRVAWEIDPEIRTALLVGGGGYSVPRDFLNTHPEATMDVIEIDPEMTGLARRFFGLSEISGMNIFHQDARVFLSRSVKKYDVIYLDAFNSMTPPSHLTTIEFMTDLYSHLSDDGFLIVNLIGAVKGENRRFMEAERSTLLTIFPKVEVFPVKEKLPEEVQSLLIIAYKKVEDKELSLRPPLENFSDRQEILSDDWAPVEFMTRSYYRD